MVTGIAIGIAKEKRRALAATRTINQTLGSLIHGANILPIGSLGMNAKGGGAGDNITRCGF